MSDRIVIGIFVGGRSSRMGSRPKGLLPAPGKRESLLGRALRLGAEALPGARLVLVGDAGPYAGFDCSALADDPAGIGPLGGLHALLCEARRLDGTHAIALSCDLPYFSSALLGRLARERPEAAALAPRQAGRWQPLFARYAAAPALLASEEALAAGDRSLQSVLRRLDTAELVLCDSERAELRDWDSPQDLDP